MKDEHRVDLKQRIVGAIVLVSLAVIILPIVLSPQEDSKQYFKTEKIPPISAHIKEIVVAYDKTSLQVEAMPSLPIPAAIPVDQENKQQTEKDVVKIAPHVREQSVKKPKDKKINQAYTIQLGSFLKQDNAFKLQKKLRSKKFKAYIEKVNLSSKNTTTEISYRVRVGPYLKYPSVVAMQKKIKRQFKIDGKIVSYK